MTPTPLRKTASSRSESSPCTPANVSSSVPAASNSPPSTSESRYAATPASSRIPSPRQNDVIDSRQDRLSAPITPVPSSSSAGMASDQTPSTNRYPMKSASDPR